MDYLQKYLKYKNKYLALKKKNTMVGGSSKLTLYLFKSDTCPHCINFKNTWDELQNDLQGKVNFVTYDAVQNKEEMKKYNIEGYPTLILQVGGKAVEFVGPRDKDSIINFIMQYSN